MRSTRLFLCTLAAAALLGIASARQADAAIIYLSTHSSDETDPALLSASLEFTVSGNTITLTMTNMTSSTYRINQIYFNAQDNVGTLTQISGNQGWAFNSLAAGSNDTKADGFGTFTHSLTDGSGNSPHTILPGDFRTWVFEFSGTASEFDFTTMFSTIPPGEHPSVVAAKFIKGPDDDSGFGATNVIVIPAPGAAVLLLAAFAGRTRRRD